MAFAIAQPLFFPNLNSKLNVWTRKVSGGWTIVFAYFGQLFTWILILYGIGRGGMVRHGAATRVLALTWTVRRKGCVEGKKENRAGWRAVAIPSPGFVSSYDQENAIDIIRWTFLRTGRLS